MAVTFCLSGAVVLKAGKNVSSDLTETKINTLINQAESFINNTCKYNWTDNFASKNADVKLILEEAASDLAAIYCICYDMSNYTSRIEAEDIINVLYRRFKDCIKLLQEQVTQTFMQRA